MDLNLCSDVETALMFKQQRIDHFAGYSLFPDGAILGGSQLTGSNLTL